MMSHARLQPPPDAKFHPYRLIQVNSIELALGTER